MTEKNDNQQENQIPNQTNPQTQNQHGQEIEYLKQEIQELKDLVLRGAAEVENTRKRCEKQIEEARDYAIVSFAKDLIAVADNLTLALKHKPDNLPEEMQNILHGVEMIFSELNSVLNKHHVNIVEANIGQKFDYNNHQAIAQIPTNQYPKGVIVDIMQIGYKLKDRLLRPAIVTISDDVHTDK